MPKKQQQDYVANVAVGMVDTEKKNLPLTLYFEVSPFDKDHLQSIKVTAKFRISDGKETTFARGESSFEFNGEELWDLKPTEALENVYAAINVDGNAYHLRHELEKRLKNLLKKQFYCLPSRWDLSKRALYCVELLKKEIPCRGAEKGEVIMRQKPLDRYLVLLKSICQLEAFIAIEKKHVCFVQWGNAKSGWRY